MGAQKGSGGLGKAGFSGRAEDAYAGASLMVGAPRRRHGGEREPPPFWHPGACR